MFLRGETVQHGHLERHVHLLTGLSVVGSFRVSLVKRPRSLRAVASTV